MQIIVFENSASLIKGFKNQGFEPFVDLVHGTDKNWLQSKLQCPHRLYWLDPLKNRFIPEIIETLDVIPNFVVYFNQDQIITSFEWDQIETFVNAILMDQTITGRTERCIQRLLTQRKN